jgi:hypothetical protein
MRAPRSAPVAIRAAAPAPPPLRSNQPTPLLLASIRFLHQIHSYREIANAVFQLQTEAAAVTAAAVKKLEVKK